MTSLADAKLACARQAALVQRARLLGAIWADFHRERRIVKTSALPERLLGRPVFTREPLQTYGAHLTLCADDVWRVARDDIGRHPAAAFLQAPMLAAFLPELCRLLLGQTLLLASIPVWWLGDAVTLQMVARKPESFWLRDGFDPDGSPVSLTKLSVPYRTRLQSKVDADPGRFIAGRILSTLAPVRHVTCATPLHALAYDNNPCL